MPDPASPLSGEKKEPVIYTIPEQFYGTAAKADLPRENAIIAPKPSMPPPPPAIRAPIPAAKPSGPLKPASKKWLMIPILAVVLIVAMGLVAWIYVRSLSKPAPVTPVVTLPEPGPLPEPVPEPATTTPETPPGPDLDRDGLINEEEAMYGASATNTDSDADGYADELEVINLYNPSGFKPTRLLEANLVKIYGGTIGGLGPQIEFLHPVSATVAPAAQDPGLIVSWPDGAFTQQIFGSTGATDAASVLDAYLKLRPQYGPGQLRAFVTKSGLEGIRSPLGAPADEAVFLIDGVLYQFVLTAATEEQAMHTATFTMLLNSFAKKP